MMKNNIYIEIDDNFEKEIDKKAIKNCALESLNIGASSLCEDSISISITSSEKIKFLNEKYLKISSSTDVLAFPTKQNWSKGIKNFDDIDNFNDEGHLGDIFISFENIVSQSQFYMTGTELELNIILTHGILHLLGYDHYDDNTKRQMDSLTTDVIKSLNLDYEKAEISLGSRNE
tara:strand:- start:170 stop:694 length:525 start_codon:yes stop_codon:yes gene_type:complete